jgi:hypothetical protein
MKEQHMVTETKDRKINLNEKVKDDGVKRLPHERDESPKGSNTEPRGIMKQAADDLAQGLVDTDLHGMRGVEESVPRDGAGQARPQKGAEDGMRHHDTVAPTNTKPE